VSCGNTADHRLKKRRIGMPTVNDIRNFGNVISGSYNGNPQHDVIALLKAFALTYPVGLVIGVALSLAFAFLGKLSLYHMTLKERVLGVVFVAAFFLFPGYSLVSNFGSLVFDRGEFAIAALALPLAGVGALIFYFAFFVLLAYAQPSENRISVLLLNVAAIPCIFAGSVLDTSCIAVIALSGFHLKEPYYSYGLAFAALLGGALGVFLIVRDAHYPYTNEAENTKYNRDLKRRLTENGL
jgi:hypothetical protein